MNDPLYNHTVFGPGKGKGGLIGKSDEKLIQVRGLKGAATES
jgi:hypothetical protein